MPTVAQHGQLPRGASLTMVDYDPPYWPWEHDNHIDILSLDGTFFGHPFPTGLPAHVTFTVEVYLSVLDTVTSTRGTPYYLHGTQKVSVPAHWFRNYQSHQMGVGLVGFGGVGADPVRHPFSHPPIDFPVQTDASPTPAQVALVVGGAAAHPHFHLANSRSAPSWVEGLIPPSGRWRCLLRILDPNVCLGLFLGYTSTPRVLLTSSGGKALEWTPSCTPKPTPSPGPGPKPPTPPPGPSPSHGGALGFVVAAAALAGVLALHFGLPARLARFRLPGEIALILLGVAGVVLGADPSLL